jgi:flavorubredoxin
MAKAYKVADETFVIPEALPVPGVGKLPINAMIIRGEQPMLLDTLAIVHRKTFLEEAFALVEPKDVRWLFLSHEDRDHSGAIMEVLERCPNATLITNYLGLGKLGEEFSIPLNRVYLLNDGDTLDIGDRKVTAIRPPLYDSSATRGLWDPKTAVYFGADCFGAVLEDVPQFTDELPAQVFEDGYFWMNRANHVWFEHVTQSAIDEAADRIVKLQPKLVVSGHGPVERKNPAGLVKMISRIGGMPPIELPDQAAFERMLAGGPA